MHLALVSPEIAPFVGGGIAPVTLAAAQVIAGGAENHVDVFAPRHYRDRAIRLRALGVPALRHARIRWFWIEAAPGDEPWMYRWSKAVDEALRTTYAEGAPDVVEFQDYLGSGAVALQAAVDGRSPIADALLAVRLHSTVEMVQAVDGRIPSTDQWPTIHAMERTTLRLADTLLAPTPLIHEVYSSFYGGAIAEPTILWPPFLIEGTAPPSWPQATRHRDPHFLYMGRMQATKGVLPLARAVADLPDASFTVTMVGGDTRTADGGASMLDAVIDVLGTDERVRVLPERPRHELAGLVQDADAVIVPSRWECCPNVGLEALAANRPLIGSRVGALQDMLIPGVDGMGLGPDLQSTIRDTLARLADDPGPLHAVTAAGRPLDHFRDLTSGERFRSAYEALAAAPHERSSIDTTTLDDLLAHQGQDEDVDAERTHAEEATKRLDDGIVAS